MDHDAKRKAELERGAQVVANRFLSRTFNPDHVDHCPNEGPVVSEEERAHRQRYRDQYLGYWRDK